MFAHIFDAVRGTQLIVQDERQILGKIHASQGTARRGNVDTLLLSFSGEWFHTHVMFDK